MIFQVFKRNCNSFKVWKTRVLHRIRYLRQRTSFRNYYRSNSWLVEIAPFQNSVRGTTKISPSPEHLKNRRVQYKIYQPPLENKAQYNATLIIWWGEDKDKELAVWSPRLRSAWARARVVVWQPTLSKALSQTTPEGCLSSLLFPWYTEIFKYVNLHVLQKKRPRCKHKVVYTSCFHYSLDPT